MCGLWRAQIGLLFNESSGFGCCISHQRLWTRGLPDSILSGGTRADSRSGDLDESFNKIPNRKLLSPAVTVTESVREPYSHLQCFPSRCYQASQSEGTSQGRWLTAAWPAGSHPLQHQSLLQPPAANNPTSLSVRRLFLRKLLWVWRPLL